MTTFVFLFFFSFFLTTTKFYFRHQPVHFMIIFDDKRRKRKRKIERAGGRMKKREKDIKRKKEREREKIERRNWKENDKEIQACTKNTQAYPLFGKISVNAPINLFRVFELFCFVRATRFSCYLAYIFGFSFGLLLIFSFVTNCLNVWKHLRWRNNAEFLFNKFLCMMTKTDTEYEEIT